MYARNATASELVHMSAICRSFRIYLSGARMGRAGFIRGSLPELTPSLNTAPSARCRACRASKAMSPRPQRAQKSADISVTDHLGDIRFCRNQIRRRSRRCAPRDREAYAVDRTKTPPANGYSTTRFSTEGKLMRELPRWCGH